MLHNSQCSASGGGAAPLFLGAPAKRRKVANEEDLIGQKV